ncbi:MAG: NAD(P)/FAD-dependent oxidoreductase [Pseudonocardiaceae bacterium]|nr:NAD(P)/FAD-dependent oxidoreductase [Pseudonocardiaceae bacterium]
MPDEDVDIVVIGMGPGGEDVAARLAHAGLDVVGVEARLVGGECPYYACVPTKMMVRAADALAEAGRVNTLAGSAEVWSDFTPVATRIRDEATTNWDDQVAVERFENSGGRFVRGRARITAPGEVTVSTADGDRVYGAARGIVLNPGTEPAVPPIEGLTDTPYWTNRDAVAADRVPESVIVLGSGPVGCEFAQVFARFGAEVTVVEALPRLMPGEEPETSELMAEVFAGEKIAVRTGAAATRVGHTSGRFTLELDGGSTVSAERLLVATGRRTDLAALGVGKVGIDESARAIPVNERMRAAHGVWAIGDAVGKGAFTHVSVYQAGIAAAAILAENGLGDDTEPADYRAVPRVTFTDPEVGAVGLTEAQAREQGLSVRTGIAQVPSTARGWIHQAGNEGFVKLVEDADRGVLVGATAAGPSGGEVLGALAVAVHGEVPIARLRGMIYAYPTFHRGIEDALRGLG